VIAPNATAVIFLVNEASGQTKGTEAYETDGWLKCRKRHSWQFAGGRLFEHFTSAVLASLAWAMSVPGISASSRYFALLLLLASGGSLASNG
jgi:hypothetical protein